MSAEPAAEVAMPDNNAKPDDKNMPDDKKMPVGPDDHEPVPFPTPPNAQSNPQFTSPSPMADNALSRFLGGPPVNVLVRLVFLSLIVGALLMCSNACVAYAERRLSSGVASLLVAITPVWFVTFDWLRGSGERPRLGVVGGLVAGVIGVAILLGPGQLGGGPSIDAFGAAIVLGGTISWAFGSIYSRHAPRPASALMGSAMHMLCGGLVLLAVSLVTGQFDGFTLTQVSGRSWIAFGYLVIFGSLVGFSSFVYLLRVTTPARVATYAYVNPVVAVLLGWLFAGEEIGIRVGVAAAVIIGAVAVITTFGGAVKPGAGRDTEASATTAMVEEVP